MEQQEGRSLFMHLMGCKVDLLLSGIPFRFSTSWTRTEVQSLMLGSLSSRESGKL